MTHNQPGFGVFNQDLDLTAVLIEILRSMRKHDEKFMTSYALNNLSSHGVKLAELLAPHFPEYSQNIVMFFNERLAEHRRALRMKKILAFWRWEDIERESTELAFRDTSEMTRNIIMGPGNVGLLVSNNQEMQKVLSEVLVSLLLQKPDAHFDMAAIRRIVEGAK